jgi:hypothetical protein
MTARNLGPAFESRHSTAPVDRPSRHNVARRRADPQSNGKFEKPAGKASTMLSHPRTTPVLTCRRRGEPRVPRHGGRCRKTGGLDHDRRARRVRLPIRHVAGTREEPAGRASEGAGEGPQESACACARAVDAHALAERPCGPTRHENAPQSTRGHTAEAEGRRSCDRNCKGAGALRGPLASGAQSRLCAEAV